MTTRNILTFLFIGLLTIGLAACSGLAGEPEIVRTLAPTEASASVDMPVSTSSDPAVLFAENCTRCHGDTGQGDGSFVQSGQVSDVPDFTDPTAIQDKSVADYFEVITNGRLDKLMPPWNGSMNEAQRWALAFYTYSMSYDADTIAQGEDLFALNCADCHGEHAESDAPSVIGLTNYTEVDLVNFVSTHATEQEVEMQIDAQSSAAIVQYMRSLAATSTSTQTPVESASSSDDSLTSAEIAATAHAGATSVAVAPDGTVATPAAAQQTIGFLRGNIIQGTEGGQPVEGLEAILHIFDAQFQEQVAEYTVAADGAYEWTEVVIRPDFAYLVTVSANGVRFNSDIIVGDPTSDEIDLDVTIYESTSDTSVLDVTSHATQFNLTTQGLYVIEVVTLENNSDRMYMVEDETLGPISVAFDLPEGAQLQTAHTDSTRYGMSEDGRQIVDTQPVIPGIEHYVQYSYTLATFDEATITETVNYPTSGPVRYFVERDTLDMTSGGLTLVGEQEFNGNVYEVYEANALPTVGQSTELAFKIIGTPSTTSGTSSTTTQDGVPREALAVVLVIAGLVFIAVAGFIIWRGRRAPSAAEETPQSIMQEIAMLDSLYEEGSIPEAVYNKQRKMLKAKLLKMMQSTAE
ncbi:MAG: c-type cytochrome [Anaerolineae bacterium]|nr:c-type cytochrome [Anaerolineae bacterium]